MNAFTRFFRLLHISYILLKHRLDEIVLASHLFRPLRFLLFFIPSRFWNSSKPPPGVRVRQALEELGPIFVKFGQILSTRPDIIPEEIVQELIKLQDKVPPFPGETAEQMISLALGKPWSSVFQDFDLTPLASASVAQVHAAVLQDGRPVVIKVLRPNIQKNIQRDVALLKTIANWAQRYSKKARQFKPKEMVLELEKILDYELDLLHEAASASQLRRNFLNSPLLYIPEVHWQFSKQNMMVMEYVQGIPIYEKERLIKQGYDLKRLAERMVEIFFTQAFRDCFFHADLHPGNIMVSTENPSSPKFIAVDFGIMGSLSTQDQRYLAENFLAFFKRDYRRLTELHIECGWLPQNTRIDEFEAALRVVCEPIFERPIKDISMGTLLLRLFQTARQFQINIQPQLVLLQKTLLTVEGLSRALYPELDPWQTARPILENWMKTQLGPRAFLAQLKRNRPLWVDLPGLPNLMMQALKRVAEGQSLSSVQAIPLEAVRRNHSIFHIILGGLLGLSLAAILIILGSLLDLSASPALTLIRSFFHV